MGGEIFVPKLPSYRIIDLAAAVAPECKMEFVGIRPGEKIHEEMITESDGPHTFDLGRYYAILPFSNSQREQFMNKHFSALRVPDGFSYSSGLNTSFLTVNELRELIGENLNTEL
jgi:FlaA1/EpsC-like NDP-sugar epimerase